MSSPSILKRALRRFISEVERRRPYPQKHRIWNYRFPTSQDSSKIFMILTTPTKPAEAAWTAASFIMKSRVVKEDMKLVFCVDGPLEETTRILLKKTFPDCLLQNTQEMAECLREDHPNLWRFHSLHPLAGKLIALLHFNETHDVLYSDNDLLAFQTTTELDERVKQDIPSYMTQVERGCYSHLITNLAGSLGISQLPESLNSGLLYLPKGFLKKDVAEKLIPQEAIIDPADPTWWWIEQSIVAALYGAEGQAFPIDQYLVSLQRWLPFEEDVDYTKLKVRHFISPVRHLFYSRGLPLLASRKSELEDFRLATQ